MKSKTNLVRTLSLPSAIAISIGGMLSGIFVLPGVAFGITGPSVSLAFLVAGICIIPAVLSKAELATAMPKSGGTYVYIDRAFGPLFGGRFGNWIVVVVIAQKCFFFSWVKCLFVCVSRIGFFLYHHRGDRLLAFSFGAQSLRG